MRSGDDNDDDDVNDNGPASLVVRNVAGSPPLDEYMVR